MDASPPVADESIRVASEIRRAVLAGTPVVALESAVLTHGLPFPRNLEVARQLESEVHAAGAVPASVGVMDGEILVGLTDQQIEVLGQNGSARKIGIRDFALAAVEKSSGGTTVGATMFAASRAGIHVLATGGIGGVHRENPLDVSADLVALSQIRMIVVCAGAKSVLDLPATLEYLETMCVPVLGYQTDEFPAFYSRSSGLRTGGRLDTPREVAAYWTAHCALGMTRAVVVANPIPAGYEIQSEDIEVLIARASKAALDEGIRGPGLTPFLLRRVGELSGSRSTEANAALLRNNAHLAAQIAVEAANHQLGRESPK